MQYRILPAPFKVAATCLCFKQLGCLLRLYANLDSQDPDPDDLDVWVLHLSEQVLHGVGAACKPYFGQQATCEGGGGPGLPVCNKHDICESGWGGRPMAITKVSLNHL